MKRDYKGLKCRVIFTEPMKLLTMSDTRLKAKTNNSDWQTEDVEIEMTFTQGEGASVIGDKPGF